MKQFYTLFLALLISAISFGQVILTDHFNYTDLALLTANGWTAHSGAGTQPVDVGTSNGLTYAGYSGVSGITGVVEGNATRLDQTGEDVNRQFTTVSSGAIYYSFLVNVTTAVEGYFIHLGNSPTVFAARVFVKPSATAGKINFGVSNISTISSALYATTPTDFDLATTYLIVVKYDITAANSVSMWVITSGVPSTEGAAGSPEHVSTSAGLSSITGVYLRQYNASQNITIDGIRVATAWLVDGTLGIGKNEISNFVLYPNPVKGGKVFISSANNYTERSVQIFDVLGKQVVNQKGTQNSIDVSHLAKGIYILKVAEDGKVATRKLVIE